MSDPTVVLGASNDPQRYSYLAFQTLREHRRPYFLVNPNYSVIDGIPVYPSLSSIAERIGTLSVYLSPRLLEPLIPEILAARPGRVIFNPGAESVQAKQVLSDAGIPVLEACTLVLLRTGQF